MTLPYSIDELDKFNKDNTQRLMYELQSFDEVRG